MILADTSVWVEHFRSGNQTLRQRLEGGRIAIHPLVVAELALGSLKHRKTTLAWLDLLPRLKLALLEEVRALIEARRLYGLGIGLVDAHLIASVLLSANAQLWTKDKPLRKVAESLGVDAELA